MSGRRPSPAKVARQLRQALLAKADTRAARQGQAFFKQPVPMLGVNAPTMRALVRQSFAAVQNTWQADEAMAVCHRLLPDKRIDVKITGVLFLARFNKQLQPEIFGTSRRWIDGDHCSSWAIIDALCGEVLGPVLARQPQAVKQIQTWVDSPVLWLRRAAMVTLVKPARRGLLLDQSYTLAAKLLCDPEDLVQKAVGWLLREAGKTDMTRLEVFLRRHGQRCARTTLRYAIERFPETVRRDLLESSRKTKRERRLLARQ
jgi:3-methyladenine DNA glycosylase AlkD